jgi:ribonuclease PH
MGCTRLDGRGAAQLRPARITRNFISTSPGAVLMECGGTRVLCTVSTEAGVPSFLVGRGSGWLTAEYAMLPGSSPKRVARESATGRVNGRTREIQRLIGRSLRAVVDLSALGERTVHVDCDVIQADGGTRTAAITGAYVALADAVAALRQTGELTADPLHDSLAAVSVGIVDGEVLLDLCYQEDARAETDMNVVMTGSGGIVEIQGTAEARPFTRDQLSAMLDVAGEGISALLSAQAEALQGLVPTGETAAGKNP